MSDGKVNAIFYFRKERVPVQIRMTQEDAEEFMQRIGQNDPCQGFVKECEECPIERAAKSAGYLECGSFLPLHEVGRMEIESPSKNPPFADATAYAEFIQLTDQGDLVLKVDNPEIAEEIATSDVIKIQYIREQETRTITTTKLRWERIDYILRGGDNG